MLLTPLAGNISQYEDGDAITGSSKGLFVGGKNAANEWQALPIDNGKLAVSIEGSNRIPINKFSENGAVVGTSETTLVTYTPSAALKVQGFSGTGQVAGRFKLKVNGTTKAILRTTIAEMSKDFPFADGVVEVASGETVIVTGYHESSATQALAANIFGYEI